LVPGCHKIFDEPFFAVCTGIDLHARPASSTTIVIMAGVGALWAMLKELLELETVIRTSRLNQPRVLYSTACDAEQAWHALPKWVLSKYGEKEKQRERWL
jgi:hypothetical protein